MSLNPDHWDRYFVERDEDDLLEHERDHAAERQHDLYDRMLGLAPPRPPRQKAPAPPVSALDFHLWAEELAELEPIVELFPYPTAPEYMRREL